MRRFLKIIAKLVLALLLLSITYVVVLKWIPVYVTPLMISRKVEFRKDDSFKTRKKWVPIEEISPEMIRAVIASEDNLFNKHNGFDMKAIRKAIEENKAGKRLRGGSTISQQTAKNVFTFGKRTFWRKGIESWFTLWIELVWGKERIMEVYLNVIETGKGIYGVQAASEIYFRKDASKLSRNQAAAIAACLPNPLKRNPAKPTQYLQKRTGDIAVLMGKIGLPEWADAKKGQKGH